jgi:hypothetical protein
MEQAVESVTPEHTALIFTDDWRIERHVQQAFGGDWVAKDFGHHPLVLEIDRQRVVPDALAACSTSSWSLHEVGQLVANGPCRKVCRTSSSRCVSAAIHARRRPSRSAGP